MTHPPTTLEFDIDQPGGSSLPGAKITISYNGETVTKTADNEGLAIFYEVPTNIDIPYTVTASGYEDYTGSVNIAPGEYGWVNIAMSQLQPQGEETLFVGLWGGSNYGWTYGQTGDFVGWEGMTVQNFPQAKANLKTLQTNEYNNFLLKFMDIDPAVRQRKFTLSCKIAAAALTTGTSSGAIWPHSSLSIRVERSTGATKVRLRLSSAARAAAFSRESPVRTRATRVRT